MCNLPGTVWDYWEDHLTLPRLFALRDEWQRHPPVNVLAAMALDWKPPKGGAPGVNSKYSPVSGLLNEFPGGAIQG